MNATIDKIPTEVLIGELRRRREDIEQALSAEDPISSEAGRVLLAVSAAWDCPVCRLFRRDRTEAVTVPRQAAMVLLRDVAGLTFARIAEIFGKDHATAMHALSTQPGRLLDPDYARRFHAARAILSSPQP